MMAGLALLRASLSFEKKKKKQHDASGFDVWS